ncbi:MAG: hypothetical protein WBJ84_07640 [Bacteroidales bacterium]
MSTVGKLERETQNRIVTLMQKELHYEYPGNWEDREDNSNIEVVLKTSHTNCLVPGYGDLPVRYIYVHLAGCWLTGHVLGTLSSENHTSNRY